MASSSQSTRGHAAQLDMRTHRPQMLHRGLGSNFSSMHQRARKKKSKCMTLRAAQSSASTSNSTAEAKKAQLQRMAGLKHGLDKSDEEKKAVAAVAQELADLKRIDKLDMAGSRWRLVFTESTASSSGKIGPFIGRTEQEFPANSPGQYINWCYLGPLKLSLLADYKHSSAERIDVSFVYLQVEAGPFKWKKDLKNSGTWDSLYIDDDFRVLRANNKNLFVLKRMAAS